VVPAFTTIVCPGMDAAAVRAEVMVAKAVEPKIAVAGFPGESGLGLSITVPGASWTQSLST